MFLETMKTFGGKWSVKEITKITAEEAAQISSARVERRHSNENGDFDVVVLTMLTGGQKSMLLSSKSSHKVGELLDPQALIIYTLSREGDADIMRMDTVQ